LPPPVANQPPQHYYERHKKLDTNCKEDICSMPIDFRVLNRWTTARPQIENSKVQTPGERQEDEQREKPEHVRFKL
jgi:hypothetical protein